MKYDSALRQKRRKEVEDCKTAEDMLFSSIIDFVSFLDALLAISALAG